jgi:hypothetical protein
MEGRGGEVSSTQADSTTERGLPTLLQHPSTSPPMGPLYISRMNSPEGRKGSKNSSRQLRQRKGRRKVELPAHQIARSREEEESQGVQWERFAMEEEVY